MQVFEASRVIAVSRRYLQATDAGPLEPRTKSLHQHMPDWLGWDVTHVYERVDAKVFWDTIGVY